MFAINKWSSHYVRDKILVHGRTDSFCMFNHQDKNYIMTLIDGVGDEVIEFMVLTMISVVLVLAWWSTNTHPDRYPSIRIVPARIYRRVTVSIRTRLNTMLPHLRAANAPQTPESIAPTDDQPSAELENSDNESREVSEQPSDAQIREMDSIVNAMEAEVTTGCEFFNRNNGLNNTSSGSIDNNNASNEVTSNNCKKNDVGATNAGVAPEGEGVDRSILIKLKYINDTFKEVEGNLDELLKDFKWRHFSSELSSESRVRLIFAGRVLADETATLRACGLYNRAVVHCLVHPKRRRTSNHQQRPVIEDNATVNTTNELIIEPIPPERAWDLENIFMTIVSVALTVVWFLRCEYSNMFTASASVALFGLTIFYSIAIFGLYLSDAFHFEHPQPAHNN